ncbi:hypothetical protein BD626DRAFT_370626, partial [Schizophyllum amplum]
KIHHALKHTTDEVHRRRPHLRRNFDNSVFPCATFNLGPRAVSLPHRDSLNMACGVCAVHAQGHFDADRGGHLILWDLKLIIRFPAGATLVFPSALIRHSNVAISPNEVRRSFTMFCPGHLSRWVYN